MSDHDVFILHGVENFDGLLDRGRQPLDTLRDSDSAIVRKSTMTWQQAIAEIMSQRQRP